MSNQPYISMRAGQTRVVLWENDNQSHLSARIEKSIKKSDGTYESVASFYIADVMCIEKLCSFAIEEMMRYELRKQSAPNPNKSRANERHNHHSSRRREDSGDNIPF